MRRIRIFEHISLDGVIEHGEGYAHGDWTVPYRSPAGLAAVIEAHGTGFDLLLGRGKRVFSDSADPRALALVSTKATPTGVLMNTYRHVGSLPRGVPGASRPAGDTHG